MKINKNDEIEQLKEVVTSLQTLKAEVNNIIETINNLYQKTNEIVELKSQMLTYNIDVKENNTSYANLFKYQEQLIFLSQLFEYPIENNQVITIYLNKKIIEFETHLRAEQTLEQYLQYNLQPNDFLLLQESIDITKQINLQLEKQTTLPKQEVIKFDIPKEKSITDNEILEYIQTHQQGMIVLNKMMKSNKLMIVRSIDEIIKVEEKNKTLQTNYQIFTTFSYAINNENLITQLKQLKEIELITYVDDSLKNEIENEIVKHIKFINTPLSKPIKSSLFGED